MNPQEKKQLKRIDAKIAEAKRKGDYVTQIKLMQERKRMTELHVVKVQTTLRQLLKDYTQEERQEATTRIVYAIAIADMLYGATMEVEESLRNKFNIAGVNVLDELRGVVKRLHKVVKSIDDLGSEVFSDHYMEIVDEIETKYEATMKNFIFNRLMKAAREDKEYSDKLIGTDGSAPKAVAVVSDKK